MTQGVDSQGLQVVVGKFWKQVDLYGIVLESLGVLLEVERGQPLGHIRHRGLPCDRP